MKINNVPSNVMGPDCGVETAVEREKGHEKSNVSALV